MNEKANDRMHEDQAAVIRLDQFLKLSGIVETGGHAKLLIQGGEVMVNGQTETRRRRRLAVGDVVVVGEMELAVEASD